MQAVRVVLRNAPVRRIVQRPLLRPTINVKSIDAGKQPPATPATPPAADSAQSRQILQDALTFLNDNCGKKEAYNDTNVWNTITRVPLFLLDPRLTTTTGVPFTHLGLAPADAEIRQMLARIYLPTNFSRDHEASILSRITFLCSGALVHPFRSDAVPTIRDAYNQIMEARKHTDETQRRAALSAIVPPTPNEIWDFTAHLAISHGQLVSHAAYNSILGDPEEPVPPSPNDATFEIEAGQSMMVGVASDTSVPPPSQVAIKAIAATLLRPYLDEAVVPALAEWEAEHAAKVESAKRDAQAAAEAAGATFDPSTFVPPPADRAPPIPLGLLLHSTTITSTITSTTTTTTSTTTTAGATGATTGAADGTDDAAAAQRHSRIVFLPVLPDKVPDDVRDYAGRLMSFHMPPNRQIVWQPPFVKYSAADGTFTVTDPSAFDAVHTTASGGAAPAQ